jgi:hypothetical protein
MFLIGTIVGTIINYNTEYALETIENSTRNVFIVGILQIILNAIILNSIRKQTSDSIGLFSLGLFTSQELVIKTLYDKFLKRKN